MVWSKITIFDHNVAANNFLGFRFKPHLKIIPKGFPKKNLSKCNIKKETLEKAFFALHSIKRFTFQYHEIE